MYIEKRGVKSRNADKVVLASDKDIDLPRSGCNKEGYL